MRPLANIDRCRQVLPESRPGTSNVVEDFRLDAWQYNRQTPGIGAGTGLQSHGYGITQRSRVQRRKQNRRARNIGLGGGVGSIRNSDAPEVLRTLLDGRGNLRAQVVLSRHDRAEAAGVIAHGRYDDGLVDRAPRCTANDANDIRRHAIQNQILRRRDLYIKIRNNKRRRIYGSTWNDWHDRQTPG